MSGHCITFQQYRNYMGYRKLGDTQKLAAAKSGMSLPTAKRLEKNGFKEKQQRNYKTRTDPLEDVWDSELLPMLREKPTLSAITLLDYLHDRYPDKYSNKVLRTLQRRLKQWKGLHGPEKEIMFSQVHEPGRQCISDFTELKGQTITINGKVLYHRLYHFRLTFSCWSYIKVIQGGESFTALAEGFQAALWRLGGVPLEHRTDRLSAAYKNLSKDEKKDVTKLYSQLCEHYNIKPTRNNLGCKHENGSIESSHGHMKKRITQALLIRGSTDFKNLEEYQLFIDNIVQKHNRKNNYSVVHEKKYLQDLPLLRTCDYTTITTKVAGTSTIKIRNNVYSVPSRLIGETLKIHLYDTRIECYLGADYLFTYQRFHCAQRTIKKHINYKHMLPSLLKKPGAFAGSYIKEDILPSKDYIDIWKFLESRCARGQACKIIVNLLHIANESGKELEVALYAKSIISTGKIPYVELVKSKFINHSVSEEIKHLEVKQHDLKSYNELLTMEGSDNASGG